MPITLFSVYALKLKRFIESDNWIYVEFAFVNNFKKCRLPAIVKNMAWNTSPVKQIVAEGLYAMDTVNRWVRLSIYASISLSFHESLCTINFSSM